MSKHMYVVRGSGGEARGTFVKRVLELGREVARQGPGQVRLTVTEEPPPRLAVIPFKRATIAVLSVWGELDGPLEVLTRAPGFEGAYGVEEAVLASYEKTWPTGTRTPGVNLLTLFHRHPRLDHPTFLERWHGGHTPLSMRVHPMWTYNRNVVTTRLTAAPAWYDGIVEEQYRTRSDLLHVPTFFGGSGFFPASMLAVYLDTIRFLDFPRLETYLAAEYWVHP